MVVGLWQDGRIGTFRGIRDGKEGYGGTAICEKQIVQAGDYAGYGVLLDQILKFFKTKQSPIDEKETLEIFAFMEASNVSMTEAIAVYLQKYIIYRKRKIFFSTTGKLEELVILIGKHDLSCYIIQQIKKCQTTYGKIL